MAERFNWDEAKRLFDAALLLDGSERDAYLRVACDGAPALFEEVQSLLAWHRNSTEFLETPVADVARLPVPPTLDSLVGRSLGSWRIIDVIGRGGMGVVYRAERADAAFRRQAAIKVVRAGLGSAPILERFHRERETLAALDHPNIARLMDGGTTPDGQPYFVMELVNGVPVDTYCDEHCLTIDQRLDLFRDICAGVQYAHQMLIIHRDIKPDNILVTGEGTPKLLDFGVARILSQDLLPSHDLLPGDDSPALTGTWMMTPDYASPEQVAGRALITTASDVYSLGVLLHVLLTGVRPYHLTGTTPQAIQEQLRSATLVLPSAHVLADASEPTAARRGTTVRQLARRLSGDLDAIVCRALGAEPTTRYATVERLNHDLDCHRTKHPVSARRGDIAYLLRTFIRRHAVALSFGVAVVLLTAAGVAAVLWQAAVAADARMRAERRFEEVRQLAHTFMFDVHDSLVNVPGTTVSRALMVRTAAQYLDRLAGEAAGDRALQRELAGAFVKLGDAQGHPTSSNVGDTAGALASYRRAIAIATAAEQAAPGDLDIERTLAMAHRRLADVLAWSGNTTDALTHCMQSQGLFAQFASRPSAPLEDHLQAAVAQIKLGDLLGNPNFPNLGRAGEAATRYDTALRELRRLAASSPDDVRVRRYLGLTLERIGTLHEAARRWPDAKAAYQESFEIRRALAESQPAHADIQRDLGIAHEKLGNVARFTGQLALAADSYRGALAQFERLARTDPSNVSAARTVAISREKLGQLVADMGEIDEATNLLRAAVAAHRGLAARDPENAQARCDTARVAEMLGDIGERHVQRGASVPASICASWRESLATRQALRASGRTTCGTEADIDRVTGKLHACR